MSLTSFLQNKDVRLKFSQEFAKPKFNLKKEILAPPVTKNYSLVGTAFDYLMRFYIEHLNPEAITRTWVAESAVEQMKGLGLALSNGSLIGIDGSLSDKGKRIVSKARTTYSSYLKSGVMNDEMIKSAILLAQLDVYFRAGIIDESFGTIDEGDITDLRQLVSIINPDLFRAKKLCVLNPTFGKASELVGGADADLLIDDMLIDIKTTKNLELKREDFNQLVGYYILFNTGGIDNALLEPKIERLGIYFSRYAELKSFPVNAVIDIGKISPFIDWFQSKANELFPLEEV